MTKSDTARAFRLILANNPELVSKAIEEYATPGVDPEKVYVEFALKVKAARKKRGLTQLKVSDAIGLTRVSVANIEAGNQRVLLHTLLDLANILGVKPEELLPDIKRCSKSKMKKR